MGKIISMVSGKGGTGHSMLTAVLGRFLAARGKSVCLVDACTGLRTLDLYLGWQNRVVFDFCDLCGNDCTMEQALVWNEEKKMALLSAPQEPAEITKEQIRNIYQRLQKRFDFVLVDVPGGVNSYSQSLAELSDECLIVSGTDAVSQRGTEQLSYLLRQENPVLPLSLIFNHHGSGKADADLKAVSRYLDIPLLAVMEENPRWMKLAMGQDFSEKNAYTDIEPVCKAVAAYLQSGTLPAPQAENRRLKWLFRTKD